MTADEVEGPRAKAQRLGKPHCIRAANGDWIAVSPGGHIRWAAKPDDAALDACYSEWLTRNLVRTPIDTYDYEQTRHKFARALVLKPTEVRISGVIPTWSEVLTVWV